MNQIIKKLSIIIMYSGNLNFLRETINSIYIQSTFSVIDFLIIDTICKDNIEKLIEKNLHQNIKILKMNDHSIYEALNHTAEIVQTEWVSIIEAGSTYPSSNTLNEVLESLDTQHDVVYGSKFEKCKNNEFKKIESNEISTISTAKPFDYQSAFIKTETLLKYRLNTRFRYSSPYDLFIRMYKQGCVFKKIPECIINTSSSNTHHKEKELENLYILSRHFKEEDVINSIYFQHYLRYGKIFNNTKTIHDRFKNINQEISKQKIELEKQQKEYDDIKSTNVFKLGSLLRKYIPTSKSEK
ncbi:glycosyltransferase family protein [Francisella philomiragia]|uniref:glycosyltransferase n=1 Tax=Francisella philomiragia TaxID=28110 RepID=UPI0019036E25|nr:glycosyltransferase [Francisella philomiragia]MBK2105431.1 glycosyltransferase [Francisella philomiragia]